MNTNSAGYKFPLASMDDKYKKWLFCCLTLVPLR